MFRTLPAAITLLASCALFQSVTSAQERPQPFYYPMPAESAIRISKAITYTRVDTLSLHFDLFRPAAASGNVPVLIFYSLFWPEDGGPRRSSEWESWAKVAAGNGIVAIMPELRAEPGTGNATTPARPRGDDFARLLAYLREHAPHFGIDMERLAIYSASGAVASAFPAVEDPKQTAIKAAVMYYGAANVAVFRRDLPVLYVRAGLDHPGMNRAIDSLAARAIAQNAPVTLLNHHIGHHGFESLDDNPVTTQVIGQTLEFVKRATEPAYQAAIRDRQLDAVAAGYLHVGNYHEAAKIFEELLRQRPEDRARFPYAEALLADKQYNEACGQFSRMEGNFAAIMPGAEACIRAQAPDRAVALLKTMPKDWLTSEYVAGLRSESVFSPLWGRADFKALFQ